MRKAKLFLWLSPLLLTISLLLIPANAQTQQQQSRLFLPLVAGPPPALALLEVLPSQPTTRRIDTLTVGGEVAAGTPTQTQCDDLLLQWAPRQARIVCPIYTFVDGKSRFVGSRIVTKDGKSYGIDGYYPEAAWAPDGSQALLSGQTVELLQADGGLLTLDPKPAQDPTWAPDGSAVAYYRSSESPATLMLVPLSTRTPLSLLTAWIYRYSWSSDGKYIAVQWKKDPSSNTTDLAVIDLATRKATQIAQSILSYEWSPDGTLIAIERAMGEDRHMIIIERSGAVVRDLGVGIGVAWAPDSKRLLLITGGSAEFLTLGTDTRYTIPVVYGAVWSPDSRTVAYISEINGQESTLLDVTTKRTLKAGGLRFAGGFQWSPDSAWVAFTSADGEPGPGSHLIVLGRDEGTRYDYRLPLDISSFQWIR